MKKMARRTSLTLLALCATAALVAAAPAAASDEPPAGQEYNLDLPGAGGGSQTPADSNGTSGSSDSGGFPVIAVVLIAGAGVVAGFAAWRLRKPANGDDTPDAPSGGGGAG